MDLLVRYPVLLVQQNVKHGTLECLEGRDALREAPVIRDKWELRAGERNAFRSLFNSIGQSFVQRVSEYALPEDLGRFFLD